MIFKSNLKNRFVLIALCISIADACALQAAKDFAATINRETTTPTRIEYQEFITFARQKGAQKALFHWTQSNNSLICSEDTLIYLIDRGAQINDSYSLDFSYDIDEPVRSNQSCALEAACAVGNVHAIELLLLHGAKLNPKGSRKPIITAAQYGQAEVVEYLMEKGAKNVEDALEVACSHGHKNVVDVILKNSDVYINNVFPRACQGGNVEIVRTLLDHGACIDSLDSLGHNGLEHACLYAHKDVVALLLQRGILSCSGIDGNALLSATLANITYRSDLNERKIECAQLLIQYGVVPTLTQKMELLAAKNPALAEGILDGLSMAVVVGVIEAAIVVSDFLG